MSGALARMASEAGLQLEWRGGDQAHAAVPGAEFSDLVSALARRATLSDLFATTTMKTQPRLTAVLQVADDPAWLLLTADLESTRFTSLTARVHAASWYEREIFEMHGLEPVGHPALGPLRLHHRPEDQPPVPDGRVETAAVPRRTHPRRRPPSVTGQGVFRLPLGPVRSGPQESAEFLFSSGGEDIVEVDLRLGFKYRAIELLAQGLRADQAIQLAERLVGTSAFANGLAFTRAVERVSGVNVSPLAEFTRALLGEVERLHNHFGSIARLAEATGLLVAAAQYGLLREETLRSAGRLCGHRYLRGVLRVGGVEAVPGADARAQLQAEIGDWTQRSDRLTRLLEQTSTFLDRLDTTAVLLADYASEHNLVGPVGRASGIDRDVRRDHPYAAYGSLEFDVPTLADGDAEARFRVFARELKQSLGIIRQLLEHWPDDREEPGITAWHEGSALGWAEAPGGECLHWVDLDGQGRLLRWRARPPAVVNWHPFAHACGSGNNLTDYPVIEASFSISAAEFDR
jgi:Ni,Fe-hydrogenase III large subunit/Ni,Fe-hydrogenase III component G